MQTNPEVFDLPCAMASVGGDVEFLNDLASLVQAAWPTVLSKIRENLAVGSLSALERLARTAKTAAEYVAAKRTHMAAVQLQMMAIRKDWEGARQAATNLEGEVSRLQAALATLAAPTSAPPLHRSAGCGQ